MGSKVFLKIIVSFSILALFTGCFNREVKVGILIHAFDNERWTGDRDFMVERITELGGKAIVKEAGNNQRKQNEQAEELLNEGVDVLIVIPADQNLSADIISVAHDEDVKVIAYDRLIKEADLDFYLTTSSVRVGEMQAEYMTSLVPKGNYAIINGSKGDNNSLMMFLGQMDVLEEKIDAGNIRMIYSEFTNDWNRDEAYRMANEVLSLRDTVDVIICGSDELVYGVNKALDEAGMADQIKVISQDADLDVLKRIARHKQTATIYKPLKEMGYKAAELAFKLAKEEPIEKDYTTTSNGKRLVPSYLFEPMLVDENTISSTVVKEGYHTSEEIYQ